MKKLSFSLSSSKSSSKPSNSTSQNQHDQSAKKEFVTEFDPSKTLANSSSKTPFIIPPIPNEWTPQNKNTDPNIKPENLNLEFEVEPNSIVEPFDPNIINGLNLREKKSPGSESSSLIDRLMLKNLKRDLERLPEDRGLEEFDDVSVEEFGAALLKGYGWYEGRGIGKNAKEDVKVVQYTKLNAKEGLGFIEKISQATRFFSGGSSSSEALGGDCLRQQQRRRFSSAAAAVFFGSGGGFFRWQHRLSPAPTSALSGSFISSYFC